MLDCGAERTVKNRTKLVKKKKTETKFSKRKFGGGCIKMINIHIVI